MNGKPESSEENVEKERRNNRRRNVAVVGLRNSKGEILMIRTSRLPTRWQPIGGGMEPDDSSPKDTLIREVSEELGIVLSPDDLKPVLEAPYDFGEGTVYFFEADHDEHVVRLKVDRNEIVEFRWIDVNDARSLPVFPATDLFLQALLRTGKR